MAFDEGLGNGRYSEVFFTEFKNSGLDRLDLATSLRQGVFDGSAVDSRHAGRTPEFYERLLGLPTDNPDALGPLSVGVRLFSRYVEPDNLSNVETSALGGTYRVSDDMSADPVSVQTIGDWLLDTNFERPLRSTTNAAYTNLQLRERDATTGSPPVPAALVNPRCHTRLVNVAEWPDLGELANIKKVNEYGKDASVSVAVQPDAPDLDFKINLAPGRWSRSRLGRYVGTDTLLVFCAVLAREEVKPSRSLFPDGVSGREPGAIGTTDPAFPAVPSSRSIPAMPNGLIFWVGKMESKVAKPGATEEDTMNLSLSVQSDFVGPLTVDDLGLVATAP